MDFFSGGIRERVLLPGKSEVKVKFGKVRVKLCFGFVR